jgi:Bacterial transcriptional activator domain
VAYEDCVQGEIRRLEDLRLVATEEQIQAELELGHHRDVIGPLRALCERHPDRERPAGQLMLALYRSGRQAEALDAFGRIRGHLARELNGSDATFEALTVTDPSVLNEARSRLGDTTAELDHRARTRPPGRRVSRARELIAQSLETLSPAAD